MATWVLAAIAAESARKGHVAGNIARDQQEAAASKADKRSKEQEAKNLMVRQQEAQRAKKTQQETVTKSPFANKKKGTMRQQFTVGAGGGSGANY
jgi:hypothetical protein